MSPFGKNLLRPCPIIDHPAVMKKVVERNHAYPTHEGAESLINELQPGLHSYAASVREKLTPVWQNEMPWAHKWLDADADYQRRKQRGRDADADPDEAGEPAAEEVGALN